MVRPPPVAIHPFTATLKADSSKISLLLDLPAELRNAVYEFMIGSHDNPGVKLSRHAKHRSRLGYPIASIIRVNKQVYHEFTSLAFHAADIYTQAYDYDFRHIVTFLNRLSTEEDIPALTRRGRTITDELLVDSNFVESEPEFLWRWVNRASHPTKKGTQVSFQYIHKARIDADGTRLIEERAGGWVKESEMMPERS